MYAHLSSLQFPPLPQCTSQRASLLVTITTSQGGLSSPGIDGDSLGVSKSESQAGKSNGCWGGSSLLGGPWAGPSPLMASHGPGRPLPSTGSSPRDHRRPGVGEEELGQGCLASLQCPGQVATATSICPRRDQGQD